MKTLSILISFLARYWMQLALAGLILFGLWKIDQNGFNRAKREAEMAELARKDLERRIVAAVERKIAEGLSEIDARASQRFADIEKTETTVVQPIIHREILREKRFSDPAAGISDGLLEAINTARKTSSAATVGKSQGAVPAGR